MGQIEVFKMMGMGGFHIHSRTGLATAYLGETFMDMVKTCLQKGQEEGMLTWLYDQDRWPSGFAGGLVTRESKFRARHLLFTRVPYNRHTREVQIGGVKERYKRADNGLLLACYAVWLQNGYLAKYRRLAENERTPIDSTCWFAYLETALPSPWFNNQTYGDTLNKEAIQHFIEVTHERYAEVVGASFGKDIPTIFTDEPQFTRKQHYHCSIESEGEKLALHTPKFKSPLLSIDMDGKLSGKIAFAPFRVPLGYVEKGSHSIDITAYGNRINAFGCLHNADENWDWFGPNAWRTTGDSWSYEYQLKPMGLLVAPRLQRQ